MCKTGGVQPFCIREPAIGLCGALSYYHDPAICDDLIARTTAKRVMSANFEMQLFGVCAVVVCTYAHTS